MDNYALLSLSLKRIIIDGDEYTITKVYHHQRDISYYVEGGGAAHMAGIMPGGSLYLGVTIEEVVANLKQKKLLKIVDKVKEQSDKQSLQSLSRWQTFKRKWGDWVGFRGLPKV